MGFQLDSNRAWNRSHSSCNRYTFANSPVHIHISASGQVYGCGSTIYGQLGILTPYTDFNTPQLNPFLSNVTKVTTSRSSSIVLTSMLSSLQVAHLSIRST